MKKRDFIIVSALVLSIGTGFTAFGQEAGKKEMKKEMSESDREALYRKKIAELPNITQDQISQLEAMRKQQRESLDPIKKQMKELHLQMREIKSSQDMKFEEMKNMIEEMGSLQTNMKITRLQNSMKMRDILTKEQREALHAERKALHSERKAYHKEKKEYHKRKHMHRDHGQYHEEGDHKE